MNYSYAIEQRDIHKIDKLNKLKDLANFWNDVRELTKDVKSDHILSRWQCLAEIRCKELENDWMAQYNRIRARLVNEIGESNLAMIHDWINEKIELPSNKMSDTAVSAAHTYRSVYIRCKIYGLM